MSKSFQESPILAFLNPNTSWKVPTSSLVRGHPSTGSGALPLKRARRQPDFSRHYQPGDPIKALDWRAFAKHEELLVREQPEYSQIKHLIIVDIAETMTWGPSLDGTHSWITKSNISLRIILHLFLKLIREGNQVYLCLYDTSEQNSRPQLKSFSLSQIDCQNLFRDCALDPKPAQTLQKIQQSKKNLAVNQQKWTKVTFISDMINQHQKPEWLLDTLKDLTNNLHLFHLLCAKEIDWSWTDSDHYYSDKKHNGLSKYRGKTLKYSKTLQEMVINWKENIAKKCKQQAIDYFHLSDQTPLEDYLAILRKIYAS